MPGIRVPRQHDLGAGVEQSVQAHDEPVTVVADARPAEVVATTNARQPEAEREGDEGVVAVRLADDEGREGGCDGQARENDAAAFIQLILSFLATV